MHWKRKPKQQRSEPKDAHSEALRVARRAALIKVLTVMLGGASLVVAGALVATWIGFAIFGGCMLWAGGVLHAPRIRRGNYDA